MFQYFLKRLLALLPKLLAIVIVVFFAMELMPGNAVTRTINPEEMESLTPEQLQMLIEAKGLDKPAYIRFFYWLGDLCRGDLGYSLTGGSPVATLLGQRLPATMILALCGLLLSTVFGILFGVIASIKRNTPIDYGLTVAGLVGASIPQFFFCLLFLLVFAINLQWLPSGGRVSIDDTSIFGYIKHLILPATCLAMGNIPSLMRYTRSTMLDVMGKDYIKTARAKGLKEYVVYMKHCFRNGCAPVVVLLIGRLGLLVSGTTIIENIFNYPGMGTLFLSALNAKDTPVAMIILMMTSMAVLVTTFLGDIALAALDPRIRFGKE